MREQMYILTIELYTKTNEIILKIDIGIAKETTNFSSLFLAVILVLIYD